METSITELTFDDLIDGPKDDNDNNDWLEQDPLHLENECHNKVDVSNISDVFNKVAGQIPFANAIRNTMGITMTTSSSPIVLNKNILPKISTPLSNSYIKIMPKISATSAAYTKVSSISLGANMKTGNGPKIIFQKSSGGLSNSLPGVRLQNAGNITMALKTTTSSSIYSNINASTNANTLANAKTITTITKPVTIQVMRSIDSALVPIKSTTSLPGKKIISAQARPVLIKTPIKALTSTTATSKSGIFKVPSSISETVVSNISTLTKTLSKPNLIVTSSTSSNFTSSNYIKTVTPKVDEVIKSKPFVIQSSGGKQLIVSNHNLIKLSQKPSINTSVITKSNMGNNVVTTAFNNIGNVSTTAQIHAIHLPGKAGLQYVRVLTNSQLIPKTTCATTTKATTTTTIDIAPILSTGTSERIPAINTTIFEKNKPISKTNIISNDSKQPLQNSTSKSNSITLVCSAPLITTTSTIVTTSVKILNSLPQKYMIQQNASTAKLVTATQSTSSISSPSSNNVIVSCSNFSNNKNIASMLTPITSKVKKAIVTIPTLKPLYDDKLKSSMPITLIKGSSSNLVCSGRGTIVNSNTSITSKLLHQSLIRKHKISEINMESRRMMTPSTKVIEIADSETEPPEAKKQIFNKQILLMPNNVSKTPNNGMHIQSRVNSNMVLAAKTLHTNTSTTSSISVNTATVPTKQLYSILKPQTNDSKPKLHQYSILKSRNPSIISGNSTLFTSQTNEENDQKFRLMKDSNQDNKSMINFMPVVKIKEEPMDSVILRPTTPPRSNSFLNTVNRMDSLTLRDETPVGGVRRKHCNCSKSQCLKLYCDCFANGEFCQDCTCKDCFNNLQYEDERQRAIKNCLGRNPSAFKPKIITSSDQNDMRLHNKGCNCKRSGCLKNYCECYEAKIPCSSNCKCIGCRNIEDRPDLDMDPIDTNSVGNVSNATAKMSITDNGNNGVIVNGKQERIFNNQRTQNQIFGNNISLKKDKLTKDDYQNIPNFTTSINNGLTDTNNHKCNIITQEVIDATVQCMLTQADECEKNGLPEYQAERMIMEELGRCLVEIIDFSIRNNENSFSQE